MVNWHNDPLPGLGPLVTLDACHTGCRYFDLPRVRRERPYAQDGSIFASAAVGRRGADAVAVLMYAYRGYAVSYPHRYAAIPLDPLHDPRLADPAQRQFAAILAVLHGCGIEGAEAIHVTRSLRAMVHGFADIETRGGFGLSENIDESFQRMLDGFLSTLPPTASPIKESR